MNSYYYTDDGKRHIRTLTDEEKIATLNEKIAALEKINIYMREALFAAQGLLDDINQKAEAFQGLGTNFCHELISNALRASRAAEELSLSQDALRKCKEL